MLVDGLGWPEGRARPGFARLARFQGQADEVELDRIEGAVRALADAVGLPEGLSRGVAGLAPRTPAALLLASRRVVPWTGREAVRAELDGPAAVSVQLVHGPGGVGKTRLALELVAQRNQAGWDAGFLKREVASDSRGAE